MPSVEIVPKSNRWHRDKIVSGSLFGSVVQKMNLTIGGGSSEIQKNILARRKLGLPKNF